MEETVVGLILAKLAEKKGFDNPTYEYYEPHHYTGDIFLVSELININPKCNNWNSEEYDKHFSAPTQSLLQKWLREKHNIYVLIERRFHDGVFYVGKIPIGNVSYTGPYNKKYSTYEEALEAGLIEGLKLIK